MGFKYHDISKPADSQTNKKSSKHNSMTAEFCKDFCQKTNLKDLGLGIKKILEKSQIGWRQIASSQSPFWK